MTKARGGKALGFNNLQNKKQMLTQLKTPWLLDLFVRLRCHLPLHILMHCYGLREYAVYFAIRKKPRFLVE